MLAMIDNYDSFTYNLVQYFGELGEDVSVFRNDEITVDELSGKDPDYLVVSPGPCTPNEAGISVTAIEALKGKVPIFGVCLGHQSIGQAFGGNIVHAQKIMHGKVSTVTHLGKGVLHGLPETFQATRYHSLVIEKESMPECLEPIAWTNDGEVMAVKHRDLPIHGVQFHPESLVTEHGHQILKNFLDGK